MTNVTFIDHTYEVLSVTLETLRRTIDLTSTSLSFVFQNDDDERNLTRQENALNVCHKGKDLSNNFCSLISELLKNALPVV